MREWLARPRLEAVRAAAEAAPLRRSLGTGRLVALGVSAVVGAGAFSVLGLATQAAGPAVVASVALVALVALPVALCYAELATLLPVGGSSYAYVLAAMGPLAAGVAAWCVLLAYVIGNGAVAASLSANLQGLLAAAGIRLPAALSAPPAGGGFVDLPALLAVVLVTVLLLRPVREGAALNAVLAVAKVAILGIFLVLAWGAADASRLTPMAPAGFSGVLAAAGLLVFAFLGFETVGAAAEEARDPRSVPRAILLTLGLCGALYVALAVALAALAPPEALGTADPLAAALRAHGLGAGAALVNVAAVLATAGVLLAYVLASARIFHGLARDGRLPGALARVSRHGTPNRLTLLVGAVTAASAALLPLDVLVALTNDANLLLFALVCLAVPLLRRLAPDAPRGFRVPGGFFLPVLGALACLALMATLPLGIHLGFAAWLGLGLVVLALGGPAWRAAKGEQ